MPSSPNARIYAVPRLLVSVSLILLLFWSACDIVEETIFLDREVEFTFRFNGATISPEGTLTAEQWRDFEGQLDGFRKDEIIAANIITARIERRSPAVPLNQIFSSLTLVLENGQQRTVATKNDVPGQRQAPLDLTNDNVTSFTRSPGGFRARLEAHAAEGINTDPDAADYRVSVWLTISLEIQGI